jgi:hypothetical protein
MQPSRGPQASTLSVGLLRWKILVLIPIGMGVFKVQISLTDMKLPRPFFGEGWPASLAGHGESKLLDGDFQVIIACLESVWWDTKTYAHDTSNAV